MVKLLSFVLLFIWSTEYVSRRKTLAILLSFQNFTFVFYSLTVLFCSFSGSRGLLQTSCTGYCHRMTFSLLRTCHTENHILYLLVKSLAQFNLYNKFFIFFIFPSFHSVWCQTLNLNLQYEASISTTVAYVYYYIFLLFQKYDFKSFLILIIQSLCLFPFLFK